MENHKNVSTPLKRQGGVWAAMVALFCMAAFAGSCFADVFNLHAPEFWYSQVSHACSSWIAGDNYHDFNLYEYGDYWAPGAPPDIHGHDSLRNFISVNGQRQVPFSSFFSAESPVYEGVDGDKTATSLLTSLDPDIGLNLTASTYLLDPGFDWIEYDSHGVRAFRNSWYDRIERTFTNEGEDTLHIRYYLYATTNVGGVYALFSGRHLWYANWLARWSEGRPAWLAWDAEHPNPKIDDYEVSWDGLALYNDLMNGVPTDPVDLAGGPYYPDEEYGSGLEMAVMFEFDLKPGHSYSLMFENTRIPEPEAITLIAFGASMLAGVVTLRRVKKASGVAA